MVAYSYQPQFPPKIEAGTKLHTLRNPRRRHARPGEEIQHYVGMRSKACRLIARTTCTQAIGVLLKFSAYQTALLFDVAELIPGAPKRVGPTVAIADLDAFAVADGFSDFDAMGRFWLDVHGLKSWDGILIGWGPPYALEEQSFTPPAAEASAPPGAPAPWVSEPFSRRPAEIAEALRTGGFLRNPPGAAWGWRSRIDARVQFLTSEAEAVYGFAGNAYGGLAELAIALNRVDRDAVAGKEWEGA